MFWIHFEDITLYDKIRYILSDMEQGHSKIKKCLLHDRILNLINQEKNKSSKEKGARDSDHNGDVINCFAYKANDNNGKEAAKDTLSLVVGVYFLLSHEWPDVFIIKPL